MQLTAANRQKIEAITGRWGTVKPLSGGDINELYCLDCDRGQFVLKTHANPPPGFFASEANCLAALDGAEVRVPRIFLTDSEFLLMEYLAPGKPDAAAAGLMLAQLHQRVQPQYGFSQNTYLATLLQNNQPVADWADFYLKQRILPLVKIRSSQEKILWDQFCGAVTALLNSCPYPALLHGDLWSGNLYHSAGGPVFIDAACYCGDPLVDIAMTGLFGGFGAAFYDAYAKHMPGRGHHSELISVYRIYPLLVHAELFGSGYYDSACQIRDTFR